MRKFLIAAAFSFAAPVHAATVDPEFVRFQGDPEAFVTGYRDGMPFFHKPGPYLGPIKGETCAKLARKDMKHDRVEPVCKPRFVDAPQGAVTPETSVIALFPLFRGYDGALARGAYPLSAGTWQAGHADAAWGYGDSYYAASDYQTQYVSYFTETKTINVEGCGCKPPHEPPHDPPPAIPLPASAWMLLAALGMIAAIRGMKA